MSKILATAIPETDDGEGVGKVEQRNTSGLHTVERCGRTKVKQAKQSNDETARGVGVERHVDPLSV